VWAADKCPFGILFGDALESMSVVLEHTPTSSSDNPHSGSLTGSRPGQPPTGPVRMCVGCRERAAKSELLRIVVGADVTGHWALAPDPTMTATGRGAYVHRSIACFDKAVQRRAFSRALRAEAGSDSAAVRDYLHSLTT
jgi:uncharacterized protein